LQHSIAGHDEMLIDEILKHLAKNIEGLAADLGRLLGTQDQLMAVCCRTQPILREVEDELALFEDRSFIEQAEGSMALSREIAGEEVGHIVGNVGKGKGEKELFGLEVPQLENEVKLHWEQPEALKDLLFWDGERKVEFTILNGEGGAAVERVNFLLGENLEALGGEERFLIGHGSPDRESGNLSQKVYLVSHSARRVSNYGA
jgi:hypothetical protein